MTIDPPPTPASPSPARRLTAAQIAGLVVFGLLLCCSACGMLLWALGFLPLGSGS